MAEDDRPEQGGPKRSPLRAQDHPIATGLIALIGVALAVGLIMGGAALAGAKVLGVDGDEASTDDSTAQQSMYLPTPESTEPADGPQFTLNTGSEESGDSEESGEAGDQPSDDGKKKAQPKISLSAGQTEVGQMEPINLTGVYPGGEGAILQVQQFKDGSWTDFPVTASVAAETFSTVIQASMEGDNRFRVRDSETGTLSNEVKVQIG